MGSSAKTDYCAFTKAVEHLGDRWSFLIIRELAMFGPHGFNALATGLPGHVSRSVLAAKLRKLEELGLVAHDPGGRQAPYRLAPAGEQLVPTLRSLWSWAERWVPEDPAVADRDPTVVAFWLSRRVVRAAVPDRQVVVEIMVRDAPESRSWLLLDPVAEAQLCAEDPALDPSRYVYLEAAAAALLPVARGEVPMAAAIGDGSIDAYGEPELVARVGEWFAPATSAALVGAA